MSRRPTNFWDFLIHLTKTAVDLLMALVGMVITLVAVLFLTPIGWIGLLIIMMIYTMISGNHGTYP